MSLFIQFVQLVQIPNMFPCVHVFKMNATMGACSVHAWQKNKQQPISQENMFKNV